MLYVNKVDDAAIDKTIEDITNPAADNKTETEELITLPRIPEPKKAKNTTQKRTLNKNQWQHSLSFTNRETGHEVELWGKQLPPN